MATIAGTLTDGTGTALAGATLEFLLSTAPETSTGMYVSGIPVRETTGTAGSAGVYSLTLLPGIWRVRLPSTPERYIGVPTGSGTYTIGQLLLTETEAQMTIPRWVENAAALRALGTAYSLFFVSSDANGDWGWFEISSSTSADDGVNYIHNAAGIVYERRQ
jgi:hypothetical protein